MKLMPDLNINCMTPRLFLLLCAYCFSVGFFIGMALAITIGDF